jgi:hypothetical protein
MLSRRTRKSSAQVVKTLGWWMADVSTCLSGDIAGGDIVACPLVVLRLGEGQEDGFVAVVV